MLEQMRYLDKEPQITFEDVPYEIIINLTKMSVGYNILDSEFLIDQGVPAEIVRALEGEYFQERSGLSIKQTGVKGYDLLNKICDDLHISTESFFENPGNRAIDLRENIFGDINSRVDDPVLDFFTHGIDLNPLDRPGE